MLQLGFGLNAFQSGLITFSGAIGALTVKFIARRTFALTGFRTTLIWAASLGAVMTAVNGFFTPDTPHILIIASLLVGGLCRSFFFTGTNALAYSEVSDQQASQATSMSSVFQQVSLALGVAFAAFILEISSFVSGTELKLSDFHLAFFLVAAISVFSIWPLVRLPASAGAAVSGHRARGSAQPQAGE
jgi:MFS family permease